MKTHLATAFIIGGLMIILSPLFASTSASSQHLSSAPSFVLPFAQTAASLVPGPSGGYNKGPVFTDVNGDGLVDLVYSSADDPRFPYENRAWTQYVSLNNGNTWEEVHRCQYSSRAEYNANCL